MNDKAARLEPLADFAGKRRGRSRAALAASTQVRSRLRKPRSSACAAISPSTGSARSSRFDGQHALAECAPVPIALSERSRSTKRELENAIERHRFETERWRDSHQRAQVLDKVIARSQREQIHALQRRDQAELDERAARRHVQPRR